MKGHDGRLRRLEQQLAGAVLEPLILEVPIFGPRDRLGPPAPERCNVGPDGRLIVVREVLVHFESEAKGYD